MPPLSGSIVAGQLVPFPANPLRPGEPNRVRLSPEGRVNRGQTYHCPSKYVNVSADGRSIARLPWLCWQQSTVYAPGCNPGFGVVAREPLNPGDYGSEYGGKTRSVEEVVDMKPFMQHTHIKAIYTQMSYWDSRWINGKPTPYSDLPPIREYLEGHYMAGLMNSAFLQVMMILMLDFFNKYGFFFLL